MVEERYIQTLACTFQAFEKEEQEAIWPHFDLASSPAVFHFKNGHVYALGLVSPSSLWENQFIQDYPILFCAHYPGSLAPLHPSFPLEKQKAFVMALDDPEASFLPLLTFIHERFHLHQFQFFPREKIVEADIRDYQQIENLVLIEWENHLLELFLRANESQEKEEILRDYVAVQQVRCKQMHESSLKWEDHQQKMEGLADYVSVKTYQVFPYLPDFKAEHALLDMRDKKKRSPSIVQDGMKGRHYFVGATIGWALDFCGVTHWKERIEKEHISLQTLLETALYMEESEKQERFTQVQNRFKGEEVQQRIHQQLEKETSAKEKVMHAFQQQEGIIIEVALPSGSMSAGGRHEDSAQVDHAKALMKDTSLSTTRDQSWTLRFQAIPLLFEEPNGTRTFKLMPQTILQLDGQVISLEQILQQKGAVISFLTLSWEDLHCELHSTRKGQIVVHNQSVLFLFD